MVSYIVEAIPYIQDRKTIVSNVKYNSKGVEVLSINLLKQFYRVPPLPPLEFCIFVKTRLARLVSCNLDPLKGQLNNYWNR